MTVRDFPVALQLAGRPVLMVGAGRIALGRVRQLLEVSAAVRIIAPEACDELEDLAAQGRVRLERRGFQEGDTAGACLVFVATGNRAVSAAVAAEARSRGQWVNAADIPELCDFHMPSIGRRGPVTLAVSTSGHAPGLARHLRGQLMAHLDPAVGRLARLLGRLRRLESAGPARTRRLQALIEAGAASLIAQGDRRGLHAAIDALWRDPEQKVAAVTQQAGGMNA